MTTTTDRATDARVAETKTIRRGAQPHRRGTPDDDFAWAHRDRQFAEIARIFGASYANTHLALYARGWRKQGRSGLTIQAPCAGCDARTACGPADPDGLDERRMCRECRAREAGEATSDEDREWWRDDYEAARAARSEMIAAMRAGTYPIEPWRAPQTSTRVHHTNRSA